MHMPYTPYLTKCKGKKIAKAARYQTRSMGPPPSPSKRSPRRELFFPCTSDLVGQFLIFFYWTITIVFEVQKATKRFLLLS
jgi:hypothetical protein